MDEWETDPSDAPATRDAWFERLFIDQVRALPLEDQEKFLERVNADESFLPGIMTSTIQKVLAESTPEVIRSLDEQTPALLKDRRRVRKSLERRLRTFWGTALDQLEALIHAFTEFGAEFAEDGVEDGKLSTEARFDAISQLNARASRVALEIHALLSAGLTDGATARWRTLHEVSITAHFISEHGDDVAEQYLAHEQFNYNRLVRSYHRHKAVHLDDRLTDAQLAELEEEENGLIERYGAPFSGPYGWAASALENKRPTFGDLEAVVDLSVIRPTYQAASAHVHSGADGLRPSGVLVEWEGPYLAGPSNAGLAEPGRHTATMLAFMATASMTYMVSINRLLGSMTLWQLATRCEKSFLEGEEALERAEATVRRRR